MVLLSSIKWLHATVSLVNTETTPLHKNTAGRAPNTMQTRALGPYTIPTRVPTSPASIARIGRVIGSTSCIFLLIG